MPKLRFLDLFAGCGGLSLGLQNAGLELVAAVERSPMAAETHFKNFHIGAGKWDQELWRSVLKSAEFERSHALQVELGTVVADVSKLFKDEKAMAKLAERDRVPDVIVGGPPCQGFSMAGRRNPRDRRNQLPWAFLDFVERLNPKAVVIENVAGINMAFVSRGGVEPPFKLLKRALEETGKGYVVQPVEVNARSFGIPQNRPRMMLLGFRKDLDVAVRAASSQYSLDLWRSVDAFEAMCEGDDPAMGRLLVPEVGARTWGKARNKELDAIEALSDLSKSGYRKVDYREAKFRYAAAMRRGTPRDLVSPLNHVPRRHSEHVVQRFALYHFMARKGIPTRVLGISRGASDKGVRSQIEQELLDAKYDPTSRLPSNKFVEPGDETLVDVIVRLSTRKHTQRVVSSTWPDPSPAPTVVTLPDDYIHPKEPRIMTVRELARIQSFPDKFEFRSKETTGSHRRREEVPQYSQVGNAVPPLMAEAIGELLKEALSG